jgi:hypothetical protein
VVAAKVPELTDKVTVIVPAAARPCSKTSQRSPAAAHGAGALAGRFPANNPDVVIHAHVHGVDVYCIPILTKNVDLFINMTGNNWKCDNALHNITIENFQNDGAHAIWSINEVLQIKSVNGKDIILRKDK